MARKNVERSLLQAAERAAAQQQEASDPQNAHSDVTVELPSPAPEVGASTIVVVPVPASSPPADATR